MFIEGYGELSVEEFVSILGLPKSSKNGVYNICCPFHNEKTPSFFIKEEGYYKCFGCGEGGTWNKLTYKIKGVSLYQLLNIKHNDWIKYSISSFKKEDKLNKAYSNIEIRYSYNIKNIGLQDEEVLSYLYSRGVSNKFIKDFDLKYVSNQGCYINDTFVKNRVLIPILYNRRIVSYEARDYTKKQIPKVLYPKNTFVDLIFNYDNLDRNKELIVVEGIMDLVKIYQLGYNVTCLFGSNISENKFKMLNEFKKIILFLDNDDAGFKVIDQFEKNYNYDFKIAIPPKKGQDPGDLNETEIVNCLQSSKDVLDYYLDKNNLFLKKTLEW